MVEDKGGGRSLVKVSEHGVDWRTSAFELSGHPKAHSHRQRALDFLYSRENFPVGMICAIYETSDPLVSFIEVLQLAVIVSSAIRRPL